MDPLVRSLELRQEADLILQRTGISSLLASYDRFVPTGSYFLDVMVYPDIDLYVSKVTLEQARQLHDQLAVSPLVYEVTLKESDEPALPGGIYIKPRISYGAWGRPWKVDIWSIDDALIDEKMVDMLRFQAQMTPHLREQIVRYKISILTPKHRTPMYSGYFVYKAFIDEGITDFERVTEFLIANGIHMG
jgi:hypothetical protein